jgi:hypothetical protein
VTYYLYFVDHNNSNRSQYVGNWKYGNIFDELLRHGQNLLII